jgi:hypothetical protein
VKKALIVVVAVIAVVLVGVLIISSFYVGDDTSTSNGRIRGAEATQTVPD